MTCTFCRQEVYPVQMPSGEVLLVDHRGRLRCPARPDAPPMLARPQ